MAATLGLPAAGLEGECGWENGGMPATRRLNMFWPLEDKDCSSAADVQAASMLMSAPAMKLPAGK